MYGKMSYKGKLKQVTKVWQDELQRQIKTSY